MPSILQRDIVILSAARTPVGRFDGSLSGFTAIDLGALAIGAAVARAGLEPSVIDTVNMGIVVSSGLGVGPAKSAATQAGLPATVHSRSVETVCGSALDAIVLAIESLLAGSARLAVAGGMESRTNAGYLLRSKFRRDTEHYRKGARLKVKRGGAYRFLLSENAEEQLRASEIVDPTSYDGLFCVDDRKFMRQYALEFAAKQGYTAELINRHAAESHRKARAATTGGLFRDEIAPAGSALDDDLVPEERLKQELQENPDDMASAYNSSTPADGGAALVLTTVELARELGLRPMARVLGYARVDGPPRDYLRAPVEAADELIAGLKRAGRPSDFTIVEANEAFGIQLPLFEQAFVGMALNVHGGAIALGHPLGAAGARITTTLLYAMHRYRHQRGLAAICYGGGGGYAMAVEALAPPRGQEG
jgi:acetyl-CoA C-acetyltransferase